MAARKRSRLCFESTGSTNPEGITLVGEGSKDYDPSNPNDYATVKRFLEGKASSGRPVPGDGDSSLGGSGLGKGPGLKNLPRKDLESPQELQSISSADSDAELDGATQERLRRELPQLADQRKDGLQNAMKPAIANMMAKMGWKTGSGLGKREQGRVDPIAVLANEGRGGLGKARPVVPFASSSAPEVMVNRRKARQHRALRSGQSRMVLLQGFVGVGTKEVERAVLSLCSPSIVEKVVVRGCDGGMFADSQSATLGALMVFRFPRDAASALLAVDGAKVLGCHVRASVFAESRLHYFETGLLPGNSAEVDNWDELGDE